MKRIIDFLARLRDSNNREWFNAHKGEYLECKARFEEFTAKLIEGIRQFDPSIGPLTMAECTYRIYRDTRFSADKRPYKVHMGAFICPDGKKSGYSGYYFQIGPGESDYDDGCFLAAGNYYCETPVLKLLREDIALDEGEEFAATLAAAKCFELDWENALKRIPAGYAADQPYSPWLRLRNYCLMKPLPRNYVTSKTPETSETLLDKQGVEQANAKLLKNLLSDFKSTTPFLTFINRAVEYNKGL